MASIRKDINVNVSPQNAWEALRDFAAVHERVAPGFLTGATVDGSDRIVTFANGGVARERLVAIDDTHRRVVYTVVTGSLGFEHHQASIEVVAPETGTGCRLVWITDVLPDELTPTIDALMDQGAAAIGRTLAD